MKKFITLLLLACIVSVSNAQLYNVVNTNGTYSATGTGLASFTGTNASTVIQSAINALTPAGAVGSGGGTIWLHGTFTPPTQLVVTGWEGGNTPFSQLIIKGDGIATKINQWNAGQNGIVVKNHANVAIEDLYIAVGSAGKSGILFDNSGLQSEISCESCVINNVLINSASTASPGMLLTNFFDLSSTNLKVLSSANNAIVLQNSSNSVDYGNSTFGLVRVQPGTGYAGIKIQTTTSSNVINHVTFQNVNCITGAYGIYIDNGRNIKFGYADLESMKNPIVINTGQLITVDSGFLMAGSGGTDISMGVNAGGCDFKDIKMTGFNIPTLIPISDLSQYLAPNTYNLLYEWGVSTTNSIIKSNTNQLIFKSVQDFTTHTIN